MAKLKLSKFGAKERLHKKSNSCLKFYRNIKKVQLKGPLHTRTKNVIRKYKIYRTGKAKRDEKGRIIKPAIFQGWLPSETQSRIAPHQKWFSNTRVIKQDALQRFQEEMKNVNEDPYQVLLKQTDLIISLINETNRTARVHLLETEPFHTVLLKKKKPIVKVLLKQTDLIISLLNEIARTARVHLLETEPFHTVLGKKKKPIIKIENAALEEETLRRLEDEEMNMVRLSAKERRKNIRG